MATLAPFVLSRATATDISPITDLMYDSFPDPTLRRIFMGCHSKAELPHLQQNYVRLMTTDPGDVWIKITERESGRIVAASSWKVHINGIPPGHDLDELPMWLGEGEDLEQARRVQGEWDGARRRNMTGPFLHLHILFTTKEYQRRGAGSMMMDWGCQLADLLGLPAWIEASEEGNFLYKRFGFYDHEKIDAGEGITGMGMRRDAKVTAMEGGR